LTITKEHNTMTYELPNNPHPGDTIREDFLIPLSMTPYRLAKSIGVDTTRILDILGGNRSITADTALRLSRFLGCSPEFWLGLQAEYDLREARRAKGDIYSRIEPRDGLKTA
jgi:addiction module HigA family antidote